MPNKNINTIGEEIREIEKVFKKEIEPYRSDLWNYCYRLTRSPWDAEDLVQDTLLKSLSVLSKIYQPVKTKSYLFKIATNIWIDQMRKSKFRPSSMDENLLQDQNSDLELQLIENIDILIQHLNPTQYVSLILTDVFQFKAKEVAEIIGTTEGAIHTNLSRTRKIMRATKENTYEIETKQQRSQLVKQKNQVIEILIEGFRKKDPELIASLLDDNVVTDITHAGIEMGADETKKNSLKDWSEIAQGQHAIVAEYRELWGRPVIIELERKPDNQLYLSNIHYIETYKNKITYWKFYCFSWDLMKYAAVDLDVQLNAEYFYHVF